MKQTYWASVLRKGLRIFESKPVASRADAIAACRAWITAKWPAGHPGPLTIESGWGTVGPHFDIRFERV